MSNTHPEWNKLYNLQRWRKLAKLQLKLAPVCATCARQGLAVPATVCDHVVAHKGDLTKFWYGERQSLCKSCHDSRKRYEDMHGFSNAIGADGWPIDKRHPVYVGVCSDGQEGRSGRGYRGTASK